jgi:hypothetical protein
VISRAIPLPAVITLGLVVLSCGCALGCAPAQNPPFQRTPGAPTMAGPGPTPLEPLAGYTKGSETQSWVHNSNPNYAKVREYGHIEWHGQTAELVAGSSRPLDMVAEIVSSCLGVSVSAEDPHYHWLGDLLDVTAPEWAAQHPGRHVYAAKPGKVQLSFLVGPDGQPADLTELLQAAVNQVNEQQPWRFRLQHDIRLGHSFFTFVPTAGHSESGQLEDESTWLDEKISIPSKTARVAEFADILAAKLTSDTGYHFYCCQSFVAGIPWGGQSIHYEADDEPARLVLQDLMIAAGGPTSYVLRCEPMDKQFCFINVLPTVNLIRSAAPQSGVCPAGYDPN